MAMQGAGLLVLALGACWHAPPPPMPAVFEGVPLIRVSCAPESVLLPVEIDGTRGLFIVDSGAFVNVVYESFARRAKLVLEDNADLVGGGKYAAASSRSDPTRCAASAETRRRASLA